ncbi:hypothetical protein POM88_050176 [Heracleum sosnowskyi]|uniref:Uncharacterized protein n=1 Tax=Heracleum sosnowskyi TaxID=360622 RepID=A0AAD8GZL6_9APIA|nr:hypothetical protein POM88_050176 [Heracleum sosnowskyi]
MWNTSNNNVRKREELLQTDNVFKMLCTGGLGTEFWLTPATEYCSSAGGLSDCRSLQTTPHFRAVRSLQLLLLYSIYLSSLIGYCAVICHTYCDTCPESSGICLLGNEMVPISCQLILNYCMLLWKN